MPYCQWFILYWICYVSSYVSADMHSPNIENVTKPLIICALKKCKQAFVSQTKYVCAMLGGAYSMWEWLRLLSLSILWLNNLTVAKGFGIISWKHLCSGVPFGVHTQAIYCVYLYCSVRILQIQRQTHTFRSVSTLFRSESSYRIAALELKNEIVVSVGSTIEKVEAIVL